MPTDSCRSVLVTKSFTLGPYSAPTNQKSKEADLISFLFKFSSVQISSWPTSIELPSVDVL